MLFKKANISKGFLVLLIIIILLSASFIVYQQKIITSLKGELYSAHRQKITVNLGQLDKKAEKPQATLVVFDKDKQTMIAELVEIKNKLSETQELLDSAEKENETLKTNNYSLNKNISRLQEEIRLWEGRIRNIDEKKLALQKRTQSICELNRRVKNLRIKAQKEIDAIKIQLGNNGYLTKNGKATYSREKTIQLEKIIITHPR